MLRGRQEGNSGEEEVDFIGETNYKWLSQLPKTTKGYDF